MADHPATDGEGTPTEREWLEGVAADRLPDPGAGKERGCRCGKMLVSNVIEVGFPCPFCGDKGGPVSAAVSPAAALRVPPEAVGVPVRVESPFPSVSPAEPPTPDEVPKPDVKQLCKRCLPKMYPGDEELRVIVSPNGTAHWGDYGHTDCGIDATGTDWWWPL